MRNKYYNKDILEAVTQGKVCGEPARSYDPFRLVKTTFIILTISINCGLCNEILNEFFNELKISYENSRPESVKEREIRLEREDDICKDLELNKKEIQDGRYWVNGQWQYKNIPQKPRNKDELKDSDNDGYDDYTEFLYNTDPKDNRVFPIIRNGNNKKIFK